MADPVDLTIPEDDWRFQGGDFLEGPSISDSTLLTIPEDDWRLGGPLQTKPSPETSLIGSEDSWEREFAIAHPNLYAAGRAFTELLPYGRFAFEDNRDEFMELDTQHQVRSLLLDALGASLTIGGKAGTTALRKGVSTLTKGAARFIRRAPVEDASLAKLSPFNVAKEGKAVLKQFKFKTEEADAILTGQLDRYAKGARAAGREVSDAFRKHVKWTANQAGLSETLGRRLSEEGLRRTWLKREFAQRLLSASDRKLTKTAVINVLNDRATRLLGKDIGKLDLESINPKLFERIIDDMIRHPQSVKNYSQLLPERLWPAHFTPTRLVFGAGESIWNASSKVFEPIKEAYGLANQYTIEKSMIWLKMLEQRGLGKVTWSGRIPRLVKTTFPKEVADEAYGTLRSVDDLIRPALDDTERLASYHTQVAQLVKGASPQAKQLIRAWQDFSDMLYAEHALESIPLIFRGAGLTSQGQQGVLRLMEEVSPELSRIFGTSTGLSAPEKILRMHQLLKGVREKALTNPQWFKAKGKRLTELLNTLTKDLDMGKDGTFVRYLENYTARVGQKGRARLQRWSTQMTKEMHAFFTKQRRLPEFDEPVVDFATMIEARIGAQSKELFLYPTLGEAAQVVNKMPHAYRVYADHFYNRLLGGTSAMDQAVAMWLERSIGKLERLVGKQGLWDEVRTMKLARTINTMTILGGLGLKPFAIGRNLVQPLITTPADLGGLKDFYSLARGYARLALPGKGKATREYLRRIGAITEYVPEQAIRPRALPFGPKVAGIQLPQTNQIQDFIMWAYKGSDDFNRYVTGSAALDKWERALRSLGGELPTETAVQTMARRAGLNGRQPWKRDKIVELLRKGDLGGARDEFVLDVIADTQYLYNPLEMPIVHGKWGQVGKTLTVFQSWWMNYGSLIEKWARTGVSPGAKVERMVTAMTSAAIAEQLMEPLWGERSAWSTVGAGPFPFEVNEFMVPPAWTPLVHTLGMMKAAAPALATGDTKTVERQFKALLDSTWIFLPGGLQAKQMVRGAQKEGWEGLAKSIIRYQRAKDYKPLWGLLD